MVLGLLDQLPVFWQVYLKELLGLLTGLGLLICPRLLTKFDMLVFFANLSLTEFQVRYLAIFCLFSVIDGFFIFLLFFFIITYKWQTITSKKLTKENKIIQLVKSKTKHHQTFTSDIYAYGKVLHTTADISNTTFRKS